MKLRGKHIVAPNCGRKSFAVIRARGDNGFVVRFRKETVHEINVTAAWNTFEERAFGFCEFQLVPTNLRDFEPVTVRETNHFALENSHSCRATVKLLAFLE